MKIWITKINQDWVSEISGLSLEEVKRLYVVARGEKKICTIEVPDGTQHTEHSHTEPYNTEQK